MSIQTVLEGKRVYRELALEPPADSLPPPIAVPEGMRAWRNKKNDFVVVVCHYTADPEKRNDEWYTQACKNLREDQIERELEINFDSKAGAKAFPFLEQNETHFRRDPPYPIPSNWKIVVGLDYGSRNATAVHWYAIDEYRRFWAFDEFYCPMQELAGGLAAFGNYLKSHPYYPRVRHIVADPSIFNRSQNVLEAKENNRESWGTLMSVAEILQKNCGISKLQRANNDRIAGLTRVHQMLNWRENVASPDGQPFLFVGRRCGKLWWELINLVYKLDDNPNKNAEEDVVKRNDHCFVAGTMISTPFGAKAIEKIKHGELVLTRKGPRKAVSLGRTGIYKTHTLTFSNGATLTCTGNHPIFTENRGWVRADELSYDDICLSEKKRSFLTELTLSAIRNHLIRNCENISAVTLDTSKKAFNFCIEKFGNFIMVPFQRDGMSTTATVTRSIMSPEIWNACLRANITPNTMMSLWNVSDLQKALSISRGFAPSLRNGMPQAMVFERTAELPRRCGKKSRRWKKTVFNVALSIVRRLCVPIKRCFVLLNAARKIDAIPEWMISLSPVKFAVNGFRKVALRTQKHVRVNVVYLRDRVADEFPSPVYNLSVGEHHEYYANGILVHNCFDELKYALLSQDLPSEHAPPDNKAGKTRLKDIEDEIDEIYARENASQDEEKFLNLDESFYEDMESAYG